MCLTIFLYALRVDSAGIQVFEQFREENIYRQ